MASTALAQAVSLSETNVSTFFSDPALFATTVAALAQLTELVTETLRDRKAQMRGWRNGRFGGHRRFF